MPQDYVAHQKASMPCGAVNHKIDLRIARATGYVVWEAT
jgi:hypothetical protein